MKAQFRKRLLRLQQEIEKALEENNQSVGLMPALWSVYSYIWSIHSSEDLHDYCARCNKSSVCDKSYR